MVPQLKCLGNRGQAHCTHKHQDIVLILNEMQDNKTRRFEDLQINETLAVRYHEALAKFVEGVGGPIKGGHFPSCHQKKKHCIRVS
jgi:hypothetical protein